MKLENHFIIDFAVVPLNWSNTERNKALSLVFSSKSFASLKVGETLIPSPSLIKSGFSLFIFDSNNHSDFTDVLSTSKP